MLHLVVNNQVGFTTVPRDGRSSVHASDVAKAVGTPVLAPTPWTFDCLAAPKSFL
jgi:2-oxoglutarate dehydrogenase complex dehydrogenase (E1) component-like enzyme